MLYILQNQINLELLETLPKFFELNIMYLENNLK